MTCDWAAVIGLSLACRGHCRRVRLQRSASSEQNGSVPRLAALWVFLAFYPTQGRRLGALRLLIASAAAAVVCTTNRARKHRHRISPLALRPPLVRSGVLLPTSTVPAMCALPDSFCSIFTLPHNA